MATLASGGDIASMEEKKPSPSSSDTASAMLTAQRRKIELPPCSDYNSLRLSWRRSSFSCYAQLIKTINDIIIIENIQDQIIVSLASKWVQENARHTDLKKYEVST